jgi:hypothetical protein
MLCNKGEWHSTSNKGEWHNIPPSGAHATVPHALHPGYRLNSPLTAIKELHVHHAQLAP